MVTIGLSQLTVCAIEDNEIALADPNAATIGCLVPSQPLTVTPT